VREVLQRQTVQMTRLVDDLLDASRVTRSTVSLSKARLDLHKLIRDAVDASAQWMQVRQHTLAVSLPEEKVEIEADSVRLNQVIQNLLHNAAKFTPNGGKIEIAAAREGDHAVIRVKDTGIGMTPQLLKSAFELFKQGQQGIDRREGGLGVGLTLAERLVALHGGKLEARSEGLGKGSEFIVRLPMQHGPAVVATGAAEDEGASPGVRRRMLVVDDNVDAANALRYLLENDGHEVRIAADGALGIALAREYKPDVLLLDLGLPRLSGYEIAKLVRSDDSLRNVVIIAITGYGQAEDRARAMASGFDHYLTKPVEFGELRRLFRVATT
jgi:CheY-like chemotaxis protein